MTVLSIVVTAWLHLALKLGSCNWRPWAIWTFPKVTVPSKLFVGFLEGRPALNMGRNWNFKCDFCRIFPVGFSWREKRVNGDMRRSRVRRIGWIVKRRISDIGGVKRRIFTYEKCDMGATLSIQAKQQMNLTVEWKWRIIRVLEGRQIEHDWVESIQMDQIRGDGVFTSSFDEPSRNYTLTDGQQTKGGDASQVNELHVRIPSIFNVTCLIKSGNINVEGKGELEGDCFIEIQKKGDITIKSIR